MSTKKITAVPAGSLRGRQIESRYAYTISRDPEPFGEGKVRIFAENRSHRLPSGEYVHTPVVVLADSIRPA